MARKSTQSSVNTKKCVLVNDGLQDSILKSYDEKDSKITKLSNTKTKFEQQLIDSIIEKNERLEEENTQLKKGLVESVNQINKIFLKIPEEFKKNRKDSNNEEETLAPEKKKEVFRKMALLTQENCELHQKLSKALSLLAQSVRITEGLEKKNKLLQEESKKSAMMPHGSAESFN